MLKYLGFPMALLLMACANLAAQTGEFDSPVEMDPMEVIEAIPDADPTSGCCDEGGITSGDPSGNGSVGGRTDARGIANHFKVNRTDIVTAVATMMAARVPSSIQVEVIDILVAEVYSGSTPGATAPIIGGTPDRLDPPVITHPPDGRPQVRVTIRSTRGCRWLLNTNNQRYGYLWQKCVATASNKRRLWTPKIGYYTYDTGPDVAGE